MVFARETVELLIQAAGSFYFDDSRHGLRDREWAALRFLSRANRFSRTPSALADFMGVTRAATSQIVKPLEEQSYLARKPSADDKRSVLLSVTPKGEKLLAQLDPINGVVDAVAALYPDDCVKLRNALNAILNRVDPPQTQANAGLCRDCIFLHRAGPGASLGKARSNAEFSCRFYRASITAHETDQLCTGFERAR
jgi:DNA-binding MarR family transcriptional regulator